MALKHYLKIIVPLLVLITACSQNSAQNDFEREAFSPPSEITRTNGNGEVDENHIDENDWRIAPFFSGLVFTVSPAFPNPVLTNDHITLNMSLVGINDIQRILVYALSNYVQAERIVADYPGPILSNVIITINASQVVDNPQDPQGVYRLVATDERGNVITYGDVKID